MKVTFVLPGGAGQPAGGSRMVLRYADALADAGWQPTVLMPSNSGDAPFARKVLRRGRYCLWRLSGGYLPSRWMTLNPSVRLQWVPDLDSVRAPDGDAVVATSVRTAEAISAWPRSAGGKFYFVQGYETWDFPTSRVEASWRLPLTKFAVSRWLCDLVATAGDTATHLPNGLDARSFGLDRPVNQRTAGRILWPHHWLPQKGSGDVLAALEEIEGLRLTAYGTSAASRKWPRNVHYFRNPTQERLRALYNESSIMIAPSHAEGWGLPACEALQCGCALVATDIGGHREFLRHGQNSLLFPPGDLKALRLAVEQLLNSDPYREQLAEKGMADMAAHKLETSVARLKSILIGGTGP